MRKLLVANRGEIAVRIFRTARRMGIRTVAVVSDADATSQHARTADEVIRLPGNSAAETYLRSDLILAACQSTGADAVHPGYGFLSERAEFVRELEQAGLQFVGPSSAAMEQLGSKASAKQVAVRAGVPVAPGFFADDDSDANLRAAAEKIGYPVLLKAAAGGGGRGMRVVHSAGELSEQIRLARDEAAKSFGSAAMTLEKYVRNPRHIEVQIVADTHGTIATLFERECSLQRRHQKLIEEAPSPYLASRPAMWRAMADASRALVRQTGYTGAGTIEFMVDETEERFYFLEVNTRLQVEHPVTEAITGLDLVELQLRVARGEALDLPPALLAGDRAAIHGHAIECRVIAEDPGEGFRPSVGRILAWREPDGPGVRVDAGFAAGDTVSPYYDSLLAKLIVHGPSREAARQRSIAAIDEFHVLGPSINLGFQRELLAWSAFGEGNFHTGSVAEYLESRVASGRPDEVLAALAERGSASPPGVATASCQSVGAWDRADGFRNVRVGLHPD